METLPIKSLYSPEVYQSIINRIELVKKDSLPLWGKMDAAQMFSHCAEVQEVANGKALENTPFYLKLIKGFVRKAVLNNKPYRKNSPTHPQYLVKSDSDFDTEKKRLLDALAKFIADKDIDHPPHPIFGEMTEEERGWGMYKHLSYHLEQFGV